MKRYKSKFNEAIDIIGKFKKDFPINKDLGSIRKKGILQEDILKSIVQYYKSKNLEFKKIDNQIYNDFVSASETYIKLSDNSVGIYSYYVSSGIPTYKIGVSTKDIWIKELVPYLRSKNLIR